MDEEVIPLSRTVTAFVFSVPEDDEPPDEEPPDDEPLPDEPPDEEPPDDDEPLPDEPPDDEPPDDDEPDDEEPSDEEPPDDLPVAVHDASVPSEPGVAVIAGSTLGLAAGSGDIAAGVETEWMVGAGEGVV